MLEGFAVARSSHSHSPFFQLSSSGFSSHLQSVFFFFPTGWSFISVYFCVLLTFFFSSPPLFPSFESCPVKRSVLSLWWYRCCCRGLAPCNILHDPVSTFVFIWHTQTYEPLWHASPVVSCQESPVNAANAAPAGLPSLVWFQIQ